MYLVATGERKPRSWFPILLLVPLLLIISSPSLFCHPIDRQQHFAVKNDYIYVLPHSCVFQKIDKNTGRIKWKSQVNSPRSNNVRPLQWGTFSIPVFVNDYFYALELHESGLLMANCETGEINLQCGVGISCITPGTPGTYDLDAGMLFGRMIYYENLLIVFDTLGIQARELRAQTVRWEFSCGHEDIFSLFDFFSSKDRIYALVSRPLEGVSWEDAVKERPSINGWSLRANELVELNCATGEVVNTYGKEVFFGNKAVESWGIVDLGGWRDKELFLVEAGALDYSLFTIDPVSKRPTPLIQKLNVVGTQRGIWPDRELKPFVLGNSIFYQLVQPSAESPRGLLIRRDIQDGRVLLEKNVFPGEILYTGDDKHLFSLMQQEDDFMIICRNAATGNVYWKSKIKLRGEDKHLAEDKQLPIPFALDNFEMKVSEGRLYLLTLSYLYALDANNGEDLWKVSLNKNEDNSTKSKESIWGRIVDFFN